MNDESFEARKRKNAKIKRVSRMTDNGPGEKLKKIASTVNALLNDTGERTIGFVLFAFEGTKAGYVSNGADKRQIVRSLKLLTKRLEYELRNEP